MSTTETTNAAPALAPVAEKTPSKMEKARELYNTLVAADFVVPEGSSIRKEFIRKGEQEIGLTKNGAITYYNNLQNEAKGKPLYIKPKKASTVGEVQGAEAQLPKTDEQIAGDAAADAALTGAEAKTDEVDPAAAEDEAAKTE